MHIDIVKSDKTEADLRIDNVTVAEILRVYLNNIPEVKLAVWRRDHPSEPLIFKIQTASKPVKTVVKSAIVAITKDTAAVNNMVK